MIELQKITSSLFPEIYRSFLQSDDPYSSEDDWRRLFDYRWERAHDHYGYALVDGSSVVGILGMMFSRRMVRGKSTNFCNLHSWIVKEAHRGRGLLLMRPVLDLEDHTITDLTPTQNVRTISKRLGFQSLDARLRILLPMPQVLSVEPARRFSIERDEDIIESRLDASDAQILHDHKLAACGHLLIEEEDAQRCYVVYSRVERYVVPYCYIHYVNHLPLFARASRAARTHLLQATRSRFLAIDARRVRGLALPWSFDLPIDQTQLYRSARVRPEEIDTLYSEVLFLNLSTFPDLSARVGLWLRRLSRSRREV